MSESRLTLDVHDEWRTDSEADVRLGTDLRVDVAVDRGAMAWVGLILFLIGALLLLAGAAVFVLGYPDRWYAVNGYSLAESRSYIRAVLSLFGASFVGIFLGGSLYFYGRSIRGTGRVDGITLEAQ